MSYLTGTQTELLYVMPASGNAVNAASTTASTATSQLLSQVNTTTSPSYQLPAYFFPNTYGIGRAIYLTGGGTYVTGATTEPVNFNIYFDTATGASGTAGSVKVAGTGAMAPPLSISTSGWGWTFEAFLTCTAVGPSGTLNAIGKFHIGPANNAASNSSLTTDYMIGGASATINTGTAYFVDVYAFMSATTTSQAMTMTNFYIWGLN